MGDDQDVEAPVIINAVSAYSNANIWLRGPFIWNEGYLTSHIRKAAKARVQWNEAVRWVRLQWYLRVWGDTSWPPCTLLAHLDNVTSPTSHSQLNFLITAQKCPRCLAFLSIPTYCLKTRSSCFIHMHGALASCFLLFYIHCRKYCFLILQINHSLL